MTHITFYRYSLSGHSHRVELFLSLLGLEATIIDINANPVENKQTEHYNKNSLGQTPVLEDGPNTIADANAILVYLASKYDPRRQWLPLDADIAADVQRYLSLAAGPISYNSTAHSKQSCSANNVQEVLSILEPHLQEHQWLATRHVTIADIANYAYIAYAPNAGVSLSTWPAVCAWIKRVEALPGFTPIKTSRTT